MWKLATDQLRQAHDLMLPAILTTGQNARRAAEQEAET